MRRTIPLGAALLALSIGSTAIARGGADDTATTRAAAKAHCKRDRAEHPARFRARYGTGTRALTRCINHQLRHAADDHGTDG